MAEPILEVQGLKKHFKTPNGILYAVDDVSFRLDQGKTLGLVGSQAAANPLPAGPFCAWWSLPKAR